jgi:hypothetical protein
MCSCISTNCTTKSTPPLPRLTAVTQVVVGPHDAALLLPGDTWGGGCHQFQAVNAGSQGACAPAHIHWPSASAPLERRAAPPQASSRPLTGGSTCCASRMRRCSRTSQRRAPAAVARRGWGESSAGRNAFPWQKRGGPGPSTEGQGAEGGCAGGRLPLTRPPAGRPQAYLEVGALHQARVGALLCRPQLAENDEVLLAGQLLHDAALEGPGQWGLRSGGSGVEVWGWGVGGWV